MLRYQLIESLTRIILYLYFFSLIDLTGLIRKACREVFARFVYDLVTLAVIIDPIGTAAIFAALNQSTPRGGRRAMAVRGTAIAAGICVAFFRGRGVAARHGRQSRRLSGSWRRAAVPVGNGHGVRTRIRAAAADPSRGRRGAQQRRYIRLPPRNPPDCRAGGADLASFADASGGWRNRGTSPRSVGPGCGDGSDLHRAARCGTAAAPSRGHGRACRQPGARRRSRRACGRTPSFGNPARPRFIGPSRMRGAGRSGPITTRRDKQNAAGAGSGGP